MFGLREHQGEGNKTLAAVPQPRLGLLEQPDNDSQGGEGHEEERDAAVTVKSAIRDEARIDIAAQDGQDHDSDGVLDDGQGDDSQDEAQLRPSRAQEEVPGNEAGNEYSQAL